MSFWDTVMDSPGEESNDQILVPLQVDKIAQTSPERVAFSFPRTTNVTDGFQDLNFRTFANAINKSAHFIHREIGRSSMFETVLYMGHPDVRHFIVLVALMKTGHKVLFSSHHNSVAEHADLIRRTGCTILIHTAGFPVSGILELCRMEILCMPDLEYLLDDSIICDHYPYNFAFEEAKNHPAIVVHTSGSTGLPRPIVWTQSSLSMVYSHRSVEPIDGRQTFWGGISARPKRTLSALPIFNGAGIATGIRTVCFSEMAVVLGPPGLCTADVFSQVLDYGSIDSASCLPITLEEISSRADILGKMRGLKYIANTGALSKQAGDIISQYVQIFTILLSTESNIYVQHETDHEDWQYACLNPIHNGIEWRPKGDLYEMVIVRNPEQSRFQSVFEVFPSLSQYPTSDLYSKHPTKANHWKHEGRVDDLIVFRSGYNFNPTIHEHIINSHPAVQHCMLVGTKRDKPAAIIELRSDVYTEDKEEQQRAINAIWPNIQKANSYADAAEQVGKEYIIFSKKEKPFKISGKGTVQRKATVKLYKSEIDDLCTRIERAGISN